MAAGVSKGIDNLQLDHHQLQPLMVTGQGCVIRRGLIPVDFQTETILTITLLLLMMIMTIISNIIIMIFIFENMMVIVVFISILK